MKKVLVLLAEGFEEVEAITVVDYLRRLEEFDVSTVSISTSKRVLGAHNIEVGADRLLEDIKDYSDYDVLVIPGGMPGATNLRDNKEVINLVKSMNDSKKLVTAICAGPIVLEKAGILDGKNITSYPGFEGEFKNSNYKEDRLVVDGNIITARGPAIAVDFAIEIVKSVLGEKRADFLKEDILY